MCLVRLDSIGGPQFFRPEEIAAIVPYTHIEPIGSLVFLRGSNVEFHTSLSPEEVYQRIQLNKG